MAVASQSWARSVLTPMVNTDRVQITRITSPDDPEIVHVVTLRQPTLHTFAAIWEYLPVDAVLNDVHKDEKGYLWDFEFVQVP